jgi:hypothetical protein
VELFQAHNQWATRPADERFATLQALYEQTKYYADHAAESHGVLWDQLEVVPSADSDNLHLVGKEGRHAVISNWAFNQVAARANAPATYLRTLPAQLACDNINHGLTKKAEDAQHTASLLFHNNGGLVLRAVTTDIYERIWNYEIAQRLMELADRHHLKPAVPTFSWGSGAPDQAPALYASDHDMFVFLMDRERNVGGSADAMFRGAIVTNSEVGASSIGLMFFLFRDMCCNHIIWGAKDVMEFRMRHVGKDLRKKFGEWQVKVRRYLESDTTGEVQMIQAAQSMVLGKDKGEVLDTLFGNRKIGLPMKVLAASYDAIQPDQDGNPNTVWGMVQGLTRHSQTVPYADERTDLDRAGRKILQLAF